MMETGDNAKNSNNPLHGLRALTGRELLKWFKNPVVFGLTVAQPIIWMGLLGKAINVSAILSAKQFPVLALDPPLSPGQALQAQAYFAGIASQIMTSLFGVTDYFSFLACGVVIFIALLATTYSSTSVVMDRRFGILDKLLATSVSKTVIIGSKILSATLRAMVQAFIVVGVAALFGLDFGANFGPLSVLGGVAIVFLFGMGMSSVFVAVALRSTRMETQSAFINFVTIPLMFASSAFFPISVMPGWLQTVANANPTSYAVNAIRCLTIDNGGFGGLATDFEVVGVFALAMTVLSIVLSWRFLNE